MLERLCGGAMQVGQGEGQRWVGCRLLLSGLLACHAFGGATAYATRSSLWPLRRLTKLELTIRRTL
eukprot:13376124-Alexandrium_andersonii.AAC.1